MKSFSFSCEGFLLTFLPPVIRITNGTYMYLGFTYDRIRNVQL